MGRPGTPGWPAGGGAGVRGSELPASFPRSLDVPLCLNMSLEMWLGVQVPELLLSSPRQPCSGLFRVFNVYPVARSQGPLLLHAVLNAGVCCCTCSWSSLETKPVHVVNLRPWAYTLLFLNWIVMV